MTDDKVKAAELRELLKRAREVPAPSASAAEWNEHHARVLEFESAAVNALPALLADNDKLSGEVERLTDGWNSAQVEWREIQEVYRQFCADLGCASAAEVADKLTAAEAKLTALVEDVKKADAELAEMQGPPRRLTERARVHLRQALAHHSAPVGEQSA